IREGGLRVDARLRQRVLAVVDRAGLGEPRDPPRALLADHLSGLPDAGRVSALATDLRLVLAQVLETADGGEERHLGRARLRDAGPGARDRRVADPIELDVPADELDVHLHARLLLEGLKDPARVRDRSRPVVHHPERDRRAADARCGRLRLSAGTARLAAAAA